MLLFIRQKVGVHFIYSKSDILPYNAPFQFIFKLLFRRLDVNHSDVKLIHQPSVTKHGDNTNILMKHHSNVTPPPAYASLFNRSKIFTTDDFMRARETNTMGRTQVINGRDYMVFHTDDGHTRLIPVRTPSATLFQYAYTK